MEIQRYLHKDKNELDLFGVVYSNVYNSDFEWYIGNNKIAITPNFSPEAEEFVSGILNDDEELILFPDNKYPRIQRKNNFVGFIGSHDSFDPKERLKLVEMLMSNDLTYLYVSSLNKKGYDFLLTFSPVKPSKRFYNLGKILPITIGN